VSDEVAAHVVDRCGAWGAFYLRYLGHDWRACAVELAAFVERFGEDTLTRIYAERLRTFAANPPPADWDGVMRYRTK
jgi:hypothetical protein